MNTITRSLFIALAISYTCDAYHILLMFPVASKSHDNLGEGFVKLLLEAGHEVTYITPYVKNSTNPKLHQIDISENVKNVPTNILNIEAVMKQKPEIKKVSYFFDTLAQYTEKTLANENIQKMLREYPTKTKYDAVVVEWVFNDVTASLAAALDCPLIWSSSLEPHWLILSLIDESINPAYNPDMTLSSNLPPFTFWQRLQELGIQIEATIHKYFNILPYDEMMYEKYIVPHIKRQGRPVPSYDEVRLNGSLVLGNSHVSLGEATRLPQNYKPIAGYHINQKVPALPADLQNIMDNAKNGVIYFSMGSILQSKGMPDKMKQSLLKTFGELKYTVFWKFEENLPNTPKNVHILNWAPQQSILAHPNCILFITHGGLLSTTEAIHFGVPMIGIPAFGDQHINVDRIIGKGLAKKVGLSNTMADDLKVAVDEMISNPKYRQKAKELSFIYHDRPVSPHKELVHWIEHVIRTGGAPHLRSRALLMPWYQKMYLDLAAVVLAILIVVKIVIQRLISLFSRKNSTSEKKRN